MLTIHREDTKIKLKPQVVEDLWHLEKIIKPEDLVSGSTFRKFTAESGRSDRKKVFLTLKVEKVEFHPGFEKLRILGTIVTGRPEEFISIGAHHSLDVDVHDAVTIEKIKWMKYELDRIKEASKAAKKPKISVLVMDERDAELFVLREYGIKELGKISMSGTGKYTEETQKEIKHKYFSEIYGLMKLSPTDKMIIAGPGFEAENFFNYMKDKDAKLSKAMLLQRISNTGKQGIFELIKKDAISKLMQESRFNEEAKLVEKLIESIPKDSATYGLKNVDEALDYGAVEQLLVLDSLLFEKREEIEPLLEKAEKYRSKLMIISHENEVSEKLKALGGVAAILRFKLE
jgi:protein pelota